MGVNWQRLCRAKDITIDGSHVAVTLGDGRGHYIAVDEEQDAYRLTAVVAGRAFLSQLSDVQIRIWLRNRESQLVGFRIDRRGRLEAEAWVPKVGLSAEEFQMYIRTVAEEADRFEFSLTGQDAQ